MKILAALLAIGIGVPAVAAEGGTVNPSASATDGAAATAKKEKKICRRPESSASRLGAGPRICLTAAEWRRRNGESAQDDSEKLLMNQESVR